MTEASPDTLTTARRLEHEFGMERGASEGIAIAIHEHMTANLVTKADLRQVEEKLRSEIKGLGTSLRGEMQVLDASLRGHTDSSIAGLRSEVQGEFKALYRHLWFMLAGFAGLIVTLTKLLS